MSVKVINLKNKYCRDCKFFNRRGYCHKLNMAVFENNYCVFYTNVAKLTNNSNYKIDLDKIEEE